MSSDNLPLPQSPQQMIETLGTTPHCVTCALYALTRPHLKRATCRNCATKAWVDSPLLLLYLFREIAAFGNALRGLQARDKDLTKIVMEQFDLKLTTLHAHLNEHIQEPEAHANLATLPELGDHEDRLQTLEQDLPRHREDPAAHINISTVPDLHDLPERVSKIEADLRAHFDYPRTHFLDADRSALEATIKRVNNIVKELERLRNS